MKTAALYVRVSTEEQKKHGLSVNNQIDSLVEYCEANNIQYKIYNDAGISAHASYKKRPALLQLIEDCRQNRISIILFTRLDRWFRSVKDYYLVQDQICNVAWKAIWEDYETTTSSGQLKVNIMLSVAEAEASRTSEKIKSVLEWKKANGEWQGSAPVGFKVKDKKLVIDESKEELIKNIFKTYLRCYSAEETRRITKCGFSVGCVRYVLKNKIYINHYITQEQHDQIMRISEKHIRKANNKTYIFSGLVSCPVCGSRLASCATSTSKGLRCQNGCKHFTISEKKLEKICLQSLAPSLDEVRITAKAKNKNGTNKLRETLTNKINRLKELYVEGDISKQDYLKKKEEYEAELYSVPTENTVSVTLPDGWKEIYFELNDTSKQAFWRSVCSEIKITENKQLDRFIFL